MSAMIGLPPRASVHCRISARSVSTCAIAVSPRCWVVRINGTGAERLPQTRLRKPPYGITEGNRQKVVATSSGLRSRAAPLGGCIAMSGAVLISWIIVALCLLQSAVFLAVARFDSLNRAALWFSGAFLAAALSFGGEIVLSAGWWPGPVRMTIALAMVVMLVLLAYGLGRHYHVPLPAGGGFAIIAASALLYWLILDLPRSDFLRQMLYQLPYALLSLFGLSVIARAR